jgi:alginate O-acetyltransferase complex protein AlgI
MMLLLASYFFYGMWDWRFLFLIILSTTIDYLCGLKIGHCQNEQAKKKTFLFISIVSNLLILGFFKYANFFIGNLIFFLESIGIQANLNTLNIILPVGISFYTFQSMSYTIDVYRGELKPTKKYFDFALYVAFFPQLVAGPIERAKRLLPQISFERKVQFDDFTLGCRLILWGLFKKVVVADGLALYVDPVFQNVQYHSSFTFVVATFFFAFQIYCDFSGYSNIAIGLARMMGIRLMQNFRLPYMASNIRDFWSRWHISLSTWLRDYLYIPLGGSRFGYLKTCRNIMITMLLGGLWHGANWTFVFWGALHGGYVIIDHLRGKAGKVQGNVIGVVTTFLLVLVSWIFFRANNLSEALFIVKSIFNPNISFFVGAWTIVAQGFLSIVFIYLMEARVKDVEYCDVLSFRSATMQWIFSYLLIFGIIFFGVGSGEQFIYFQF